MKDGNCWKVCCKKKKKASDRKSAPVKNTSFQIEHFSTETGEKTITSSMAVMAVGLYAAWRTVLLCHSKICNTTLKHSLSFNHFSDTVSWSSVVSSNSALALCFTNYPHIIKRIYSALYLFIRICQMCWNYSSSVNQIYSTELTLSQQ